LIGRAASLRDTGRTAEATVEARHGLAVAREVGYPAGEFSALTEFGWVAHDTQDFDDMVRLARQAAQVAAGIPPSLARLGSFLLTVALELAGDLAAAERISAAGLARAQEAGDVWNQQALLVPIADLDLRAGRVEDAAARLREVLQMCARTGSWSQ